MKPFEGDSITFEQLEALDDFRVDPSPRTYWQLSLLLVKDSSLLNSKHFAWWLSCHCELIKQIRCMIEWEAGINNSLLEESACTSTPHTLAASAGGGTGGVGMVHTGAQAP